MIPQQRYCTARQHWIRGGFRQSDPPPEQAGQQRTKTGITGLQQEKLGAPVYPAKRNYQVKGLP
ncbi:hypothetical protein [Vogesella alkaliphila]|uniref:hypothetical protein n=1 Tax=Vogesella alkaliphila TaxID=1193621 RepID=UPI001677D096|nr:hypothetical protein [Vogesella alkaliphila]